MSKISKKECIAMLLAGGQGTRLGVLTSSVAKPAVPFGAKYRIIDFPLSNSINSGIDTIGVLTQYRPFELHQYIGNGQPWDLDRLSGGIYVLPPYMGAKSGEWYKGTANAIYQNIDFIDNYSPGYVCHFEPMTTSTRWIITTCSKSISATMQIALSQCATYLSRKQAALASSISKRTANK